jgi:hypothetical protein
MTTTKPIMIQVTGETTTDDFSFGAGQVLAIINGAVPAELASISRPYSGQLPASAKTLDAVRFAQDVADARQLRRPVAADAPRLLTRAHICDRFSWTDDDFQRAERLGFPRANGQQIFRRLPFGASRVAVYMAQAVDQWETDFTLLARRTVGV